MYNFGKNIREPHSAVSASEASSATFLKVCLVEFRISYYIIYKSRIFDDVIPSYT